MKRDLEESADPEAHGYCGDETAVTTTRDVPDSCSTTERKRAFWVCSQGFRGPSLGFEIELRRHKSVTELQISHMYEIYIYELSIYENRFRTISVQGVVSVFHVVTALGL